MYTDLSTIYERAGRIEGERAPSLRSPFSVCPTTISRIPFLISPGISPRSRFSWIVLHNRQIYPPINVLPSLSRLMKSAIGKDIQAMKAVVGEEALSCEDLLYLEFVDRKFVSQGTYDTRDIFHITSDPLGRRKLFCSGAKNFMLEATASLASLAC